MPWESLSTVLGGVKVDVFEAGQSQLVRSCNLKDELEENSTSLRLLIGDLPLKKDRSSAPTGLGLKYLPLSFLRMSGRDSNGGFGQLTVTSQDDSNIETVVHKSWSCFKIKQITRNAVPRLVPKLAVARRNFFPTQSDPKMTYTWLQINIFVLWDLRRGVTLVLYLSDSTKFCDTTRFRESLKQFTINNHNAGPYAWHELLATEVEGLYNRSVWKLRDFTREIEKRRYGIRNQTTRDIDFSHFHEVGRHIIHSNEVLDVAVRTLEKIQHSQLLLRKYLKGPLETSKEIESGFEKTQQQLESLDSDFKAILARSRTLDDRLKNEINLAFNMVSQADNSIMKTIALITLVFIPGTFFSSLFGMNFFSYSPPSDSVNDSTGVSTASDFWIYWAITLPLTLFLLCAWYWRYILHFMYQPESPDISGINRLIP